MTKIKEFVHKNGSHIATYSGLILMIGTVAEAVRATYKSSQKIKKYKEENKLEKLPFNTTIKLVWKNYIPTALGLVTSGTLVVVGDRLGEKKCIGLMTAYTASEATIKELTDKTKEVVGGDTFKKIEDKIAEDKIEKVAATVDPTTVVGAEQIIIEPITSQKILGTWNGVQAVANRLNNLMNLEGYGSVTTFNTWLYELGLNGVDVGEDWGWSIEHLISITATIKDIQGVKYVCINYENRPTEKM